MLSAPNHDPSQDSSYEAARLEALRGYAVLDTPPEPVFDHLTGLTAQVFRAPVAIIGFLDESRHWFKSAVGTDLRWNRRAESFCTHTILQDGVFQVPDALQDYRFSDLPVVKSGVRAYAGAPLTTLAGQRIGSLCLFDTAPRASLEVAGQRLLTSLAAEVMRVLNERLIGESDPTARLEDLLERLHLQRQPMFGRGESAPPEPPRVTPGPSAHGSFEDRLMARIRAAPPAPTSAFLVRLPENRVLISHQFGTARADRVWQLWTLSPQGAPRPLEAFTDHFAVLDCPPDAKLLLLSEEIRGTPSSLPLRVLASGKLV